MKSGKVICCLAFVYISISACLCEENEHNNEPLLNPHLRAKVDLIQSLDNDGRRKNAHNDQKSILDEMTHSKEAKSDSGEDKEFQAKVKLDINKNEHKPHELLSSDSLESSEEEASHEKVTPFEEEGSPFRKRPSATQPHWTPYTRPQHHKPPYNEGSSLNGKPSSLGGSSNSNKPPKGKPPSQTGSSYHERPPPYGKPPSHLNKPSKEKPSTHGGSSQYEKPPKPTSHNNKPPKEKPPTVSGSSHHAKPPHHEKPPSHHPKPPSHHAKPPSHHEKPHPHHEKPSHSGSSHHEKPSSQGESSEYETPPSQGGSSEKPSLYDGKPPYGKPPSKGKPTSQTESCCQEKPQSYHSRPSQNRPQKDEDVIDGTSRIDIENPEAIISPPKEQGIVHPLLFHAQPVIPQNEKRDKFEFKQTFIDIK